MSALSSKQIIASLLALVIFLFCGWQVFTGAKRVLLAQADIDRLQNRNTTLQTIDPENWVIDAGSHGAAGAVVQARLRAAARMSDISLTRVALMPPEKARPSMVRASAQANGQTEAMARFLYQLESTKPALVLERVRLSDDGDTGLDLDLGLIARTRTGDAQ